MIKQLRLFRTTYSGRYGDRTSASATMEGAARAAIMRLLQGDYDAARIYDNRFGEGDTSHAVTISMRGTSVDVRWHNPDIFPRNGASQPARPEHPPAVGARH